MYLKYFGFREAPFNVTPDPKFFYDNPGHREALAALVYGIKGKKGFVVITGEVGTGKTTLIRKVLRGLEATHHAIFIFNTLLNFDELLQNILEELGVDPSGMSRVTMLNQLNAFLLDKVRSGHTVSLLIDEAQNLSEDTLEAVRLLSNLETDREKLLQIILVGQPELDAKLNDPSLRQLKQRIALRCRLDRLAERSVGDYIRHRLDVAGYEGQDIFAKAALASIWEYTLGTPRLINAICDNALLTAFALSKKVVSVDIIREVANDLGLKASLNGNDFVVPDAGELERHQSKNVAKVVDLGKAGTEQRARGLKAEQDLPRFARHSTREAVVELGAARELHAGPQSGGLVVPDSRDGHRRWQARNVSGVAELKERKLQDKIHAVEEAEESPAAAEISKSERFTMGQVHIAGDSPQGAILSPLFFDKMILVLTEAMGPMAALVVKDQIAKLGESMDRFPKKSLSRLLPLIKREILNESLRQWFEEQITEEMQRPS